MSKAITAAQAMLHPTVVATINTLAGMTQRLQDEIDDLKAALAAEREACAKVCEARYMGDNNREDMEAKRCAEAIRARSEV